MVVRRSGILAGEKQGIMNGKKIRLAIITSHPIQYNAPLFKLLAESEDIHPGIFYTWEQSAAGAKYDPDFGKKIEWNIPLLEGYEYHFVRNTASDPGTHHFKGLVNPSLNKEVKEWRPDAILVFGWSFDSHLKCLRYFHNKTPVLFRGDSTLLDETAGIKQQLRRLFLKWVYRHIDYALYVGQNNRDYYLKHGLRNDQLAYAPHAVDNGRFAEPDEIYRKDAVEWRSRLGVAEDDLVLLFAGKLEPKKNPQFLLEIAKRVTSPRLKIVFTGNGVLEADLQQAADGDSRIRFIGFQNQLQMPVVYRLGDLFILPSQGPGETWGLGANEAMACGCAILMSEKAGGAIDLVEENVNGIVFQTGDVEKCVVLIGRLLADKGQLEEMKQASRARVGTFSYHRFVDAIHSLPLFHS
jgi:glycosyltransferase involved in cell wall biosynthesis